MLEVFLVCLFVGGLNWLIRKIMLHYIGKTDKASKSVRLRNIYRLIRIIVLVFFTILMCFELYYIFANVLPLLSGYIAVRQLVLIICLIGTTYATMALPISGLTISDFLKKNKEYALFLRGFSHDSYDPQNVLDKVDKLNAAKDLRKPSKKNVMMLPFSERDFCKALKKHIPVYSIGMTKELESPEGSKRIYLDDETWKQDVLMLINKAKYIFVLVNPSDSCIWEIRQCDSFAKNKTMYIIDDEDNFSLLTKKMQDDIPNVLKFTSVSKYNMIYTLKDYRRVRTYQNDYNGFQNVLKTYFEEIKNSEK